MKANPKQFKPRFAEMPIAEAGLWLDRPGWIVQLKADGVWHEETIAGSVIVGERMRDGSIFVFDLPICAGQDLRREPLRFRLNALRDFLATCGDARLKEIPSGTGSEFLEAVLRDGFEGVVAKDPEGFFGFDWVKLKRCATFDCRVIAKHDSKQSIELELDGERVGWCACLYSNFDRVKIGDVVEVACHSRHASGKLREPRFVRVRYDKGES